MRELTTRVLELSGEVIVINALQTIKITARGRFEQYQKISVTTYYSELAT